MTLSLIHVRKARWKDADAIVALVNQLALQDSGKPSSFRKSDVYRLLLWRRFPMLVAEWQGQVAGMVMYHTAYGLFSATIGCEVLGLVVHEAYRRRGIGKALMKAVVAIARRKGWLQVGWHVVRTNDPAKAFYLSLGATLNENVCYGGFRGATLERLSAFNKKKD